MQRHAAKGLRVTPAFLVAAAATAVVGIGTMPWLPLHLLLVGGVLSAIGGALAVGGVAQIGVASLAYLGPGLRAGCRSRLVVEVVQETRRCRFPPRPRTPQAS